MRLIFILVLHVLILTASCTLADSLSNFDCSMESEVYNLLLKNHDVWIDELYDMGEYPMGGRAIYLPEDLGVVYVTGPDGVFLGYREWDIEGKLLVVRTARDIYIDGDEDYGIFGSFGYIYSEQLNLSEAFTEYDFKTLSSSIYCYSINRAGIVNREVLWKVLQGICGVGVLWLLWLTRTRSVGDHTNRT